MPDWFRRRAPREREGQTPDVPAGLVIKCEKCHQILFNKDFGRDLKVCSHCGFHHKLTADERIAYTVDPGTFAERDTDLITVDPLGFPDYASKLDKGCSATGRREALVTGTALIDSLPCVLAIADFRFMGGSMGSVFGEKFVRAAEHAMETKVPMVAFCASGGARMQEGLFGLMQMAKTSAAVAQLAEAGTPYLVVLTDPTTGGAFASFASLGDVILAEPGAYIGFAGTRVAQQAQTQKPPANYQTAEFQEDRGMVDRVVHRKEMRETLGRLLAFFGGEPVAEDKESGAAPLSGAALNGKVSG